MHEALKSSQGAAPKLILFRDDGQSIGAYISGDETAIRCYGDCLMVMMLQLLAVYYVFDLDYPKANAMFLGLLQQFVLDEPFTKESSKKFKFFAKKMRSFFNKN